MSKALRHEHLGQTAFLPIGFILLSSWAGCAMGPGYGAAPRQDSTRTSVQPPSETAPLQRTGEPEKAVAREGNQRNADPARVEKGNKPASEGNALTQKQPQRKDKKRPVTTPKPPSQKLPPPPSADSSLPPLPSKPPAIGGSGG